MQPVNNILTINNRNNVSFGASNQKIVNLLYAYSECKINDNIFSNNFERMLAKKKQNKPSKIQNVINHFRLLQESAPEERSIEKAELLHSITIALNNLKKNNKYDKIIKKDYSKYV